MSTVSVIDHTSVARLIVVVGFRRAAISNLVSSPTTIPVGNSAQVSGVLTIESVLVVDGTLGVN